ncbi:MAG: HDIG domain-containing protein, partial [Balneolaceae bacterium]|nr:HDIG domain-containing protein [Balneolaceae bacterium]
QEKNLSNLTFPDKSWQALLQNYYAVNTPGVTPDTKTTPPDRFVGYALEEQLESITSELLNEGVIDLDKGEIDINELTVRNLKKQTERTYNLANVFDLDEAQEFAKLRLRNNFRQEIADAGFDIFNAVIRPNFIYQPQLTQQRIQEAIDNISKTKGAVAQGQVIIRRGDIVTPEKYNMLQSLAEARAKNATEFQQWLRFTGDIISIIAISIVFFLYLYLYRHYIFENNALLLLVFIAMSIVCVASSFTFRIDGVSPYIVPIAVAPIILTIIFDSRVGLLSTITLALLTGLIYANNFEYVVATTVACSLGLFSVRDIKKRSQFFFTTPGIVFLSYLIVLVGFNLTALASWSDFLTDLLFVGINSVFILFTYPLILFFEKSFKVTTDFTLLELSDTNLPLLKSLMTKAPGTFHHSLQVANLAEAAAGAIGANALLCRVGALYHDIGKMENPEYFTENQAGHNEHDKLKPRMSALVIKAHVSNGVKIAQEYNLPKVVIDFIKTHHGTSLIKYFYRKAQENADSDRDEIREEDFRYDGPLPRRKETGILLLADGVEAASRAMKDPNYQKLDNLVNKMVDDRVNEGQLSKCPLTFQDLRTIKESFMNILVGIYHSRVEYPDDKKPESAMDEESRTSLRKTAEREPPTDGKEKESEPSSKSSAIDDYINT